MKLKEKTININFLETFRVQTDYRFNCLSVGNAFKTDFVGLIVGGQDGVLRIYDITKIDACKPQILLETKGGSILCMAIHDVTGFYYNDLVVGDTNGTVTVFCNQQILCRHSLAKDSLTALQIHTDQFGNNSIVTCDESGNISAILPSKELWRINKNNLNLLKGPSQKVKITSLLSTQLVTSNGEKCSYVLAADDNKQLHFLHQGQVVMTIATPAIVTAMCSGIFLEATKLDVGTDPAAAADRTQVALGCTNGAIYILHNFTLTEEEYANAHYHVTELLCHPSANGKADYLLCSGHFNALQIYADGKKVGHFEMPDWVSSMTLMTTGLDRREQLVIGCLDNTILGLNLQEM